MLDRRREPRPGHPQLAFQDRDLVPQRQDLQVLVPIAHRQQAQQRERVGHTQVGQSEQHPGHHAASTDVASDHERGYEHFETLVLRAASTLHG
jgi:hypothetical protein